MEGIEFTERKNTFSMLCRVKTRIHAKADVIWDLLTDAEQFSRWNSTVTGIDGHIREGERIRIHVPGTNRTFRPVISNVEVNKRMIWSNGFAPLFKGTRTFELTPLGDDCVEFVMEEKFSGLVFAIVKNSLPDFRIIFEDYARDLRKEAEQKSSIDTRPHLSTEFNRKDSLSQIYR